MAVDIASGASYGAVVYDSTDRVAHVPCEEAKKLRQKLAVACRGGVHKLVAWSLASALLEGKDARTSLN
jgi:hypothetical protein